LIILLVYWHVKRNNFTFEGVVFVVIIVVVVVVVAVFDEVTFVKEFMVLVEAVNDKVSDSKLSVILLPTAVVALFVPSKLEALVCGVNCWAGIVAENTFSVWVEGSTNRVVVCSEI
jgi:hypothetical protein